MKPQIVNIINFIRGVEPRDRNLDLLEPVVNQINLLKKYNLEGTFLFQYDALLDEKFVNLFKNETNEQFEIGLWLEIMQPLVEKVGIQWRGRKGYSWDWHSDIGFSVGYTVSEREKIIDEAMCKFKNTFGYYPKSVGSWIIDTHSLEYMANKYKIIASCNCKDQWGTDGYTLWGGYYGQAYYPSNKNVFCPAQTQDCQIKVPVFRMLGSDPIYQYDLGLDLNAEKGTNDVQHVVSLEPVYKYGGGSPEWVRWFFKENFNEYCLSFGYAQVGQENSFGWKKMEKGLVDQIELLADKVEKNEIRVETLSTSGEWYRSQYKTTPASVIAALSDSSNKGNKSIWYCSKYYRINIMQQYDRVWIRDIHIFNQNYKERYAEKPCVGELLTYDNLPVIDGNRWSGNGIRAGIFPKKLNDVKHTSFSFGEPILEEINQNTMSIKWEIDNDEIFEIICSENEILIGCTNDNNSWFMEMNYNICEEFVKEENKTISYRHNKYDYTIDIKNGEIRHLPDKNILQFIPEHNGSMLKFRTYS